MAVGKVSSPGARMPGGRRVASSARADVENDSTQARIARVGSVSFVVSDDRDRLAQRRFRRELEKATVCQWPGLDLSQRPGSEYLSWTP